MTQQREYLGEPLLGAFLLMILFEYQPLSLKATKSDRHGNIIDYKQQYYEKKEQIYSSYLSNYLKNYCLPYFWHQRTNQEGGQYNRNKKDHPKIILCFE